MSCGSSVAPIQAGWLADLLGAPLPDEPHATCASCVMLPPVGAPYSPRGPWFNPATRCCTYTPALHNFLVGRLLLDPDPALDEGRARVRGRLTARAGVSPLGVRPIWTERALYRPGGRFGHSPALRCPYYVEGVGGTCGIWRHRNGVCSTWFCRHDRGARGQRFWKATERLLLGVEQALTRWCVLQLDPGDDALEVLFRPSDGAHDADVEDDVDGADPAAYRARWGRWFATYSPYDVLELPRELLDLLPRLAEGSLAEARAAIEADLGLALDDDLVQRLVDFEVLVPAGQGAPDADAAASRRREDGREP